MVGFDHAVLGGDSTAFNQRQQVTLNPFAGYIRPGGLATALTDFIELIDKHDTVLFNRFNGLLFQLFRIDQFGGFFLNQQFESFFDLHFAWFLFLSGQVLEHGL